VRARFDHAGNASPTGLGRPATAEAQARTHPAGSPWVECCPSRATTRSASGPPSASSSRTSTWSDTWRGAPVLFGAECGALLHPESALTVGAARSDVRLGEILRRAARGGHRRNVDESSIDWTEGTTITRASIGSGGRPARRRRRGRIRRRSRLPTGRRDLDRTTSCSQRKVPIASRCFVRSWGVTGDRRHRRARPQRTHLRVRRRRRGENIWRGWIWRRGRPTVSHPEYTKGGLGCPTPLP
jgi:hypothetical protein